MQHHLNQNISIIPHWQLQPLFLQGTYSVAQHLGLLIRGRDRQDYSASDFGIYQRKRQANYSASDFLELSQSQLDSNQLTFRRRFSTMLTK